MPFGTTDWSSVEATEHPGDTGRAFWRTQRLGPVRGRVVEHTAGSLADHWGSKGHFLLCLERGELHTERDDGRRFVPTPGMSYQVADGAKAPCSSSPPEAKLFTVD